MLKYNFIGLAQRITIFFLLVVGSYFNISSRLSPNPCISCHKDGRYMHLHIDENPSIPLPTSIRVGNTYNITLTIQNFCSESQNNVMSNVRVTLKPRAGHSLVDTPTRVIAMLPVGGRDLTWKISGDSAGLEVLDFEATATNPHNNLTLFDSLFYDLEVLPSSAGLHKITFLITDTSDIPLTDAVIRIGSVEIFTDINGIATLSLPERKYDYFVTNIGFQTSKSNITLKSELYLEVKLARLEGDGNGTGNLALPFLRSPWFVVFLAVILGASGFGIGLLCMHGGNSMRSRFFIVSTAAILAILGIITMSAFGVRIPSPPVNVFGVNYYLTHWIGWIGIGYLIVFMALLVVSKRKAKKLYPKLFRVHVIGNLFATIFATFHFMYQITRPAENYPVLGTGVVLYISIIGLALTGYCTAFRFFRTESKKIRFLHMVFASTIVLVVFWHIIHGISNPF